MKTIGKGRKQVGYYIGYLTYLATWFATVISWPIQHQCKSVFKAVAFLLQVMIGSENFPFEEATTNDEKKEN